MKKFKPMKKLNRMLPLLLAGLLQTLPLLRTALPAVQNAAAPAWAYVFPWVAGGLAFFGYDAISSASSISISPPTATIGVFYSGTVTYSGGHAGSVTSMSLSNSAYSGGSWYCLSSGSPTLAPGLTISYAGGNTATVSGTPTGSPSTNLFRLIAYKDADCSTASHYDTKEDTRLIIQPVGGAAYAPSFASQPQNGIAQVGSTVILSGGAVGNPVPQYSWLQGITPIPGATNNSLVISNVQLTNAGVYTLVASNSQGKATSPAYLSVCQTPGSNILALDYTNYYPAGNALTMSSVLTNVPAATTTYAWYFNLASIGVSTPNLSFTPTPGQSGTYSVFFNSTLSGSTIVNSAEYDSYWAFGYVPGFTNAPAGVSTNTGANVTFSVAVTGTAPAVSWYLNATNLISAQTLAFNPASAAANAAATNLSITLTNVSVTNAGSYTVVLNNNWGSITSTPAMLVVAPALSVSTPAGQTNYTGNNVALTVTASGTPPLSYQWLKGGTSLNNGGVLSGTTTTNLNIAPAALTNSGNYSVVVTNTSGSVTSGVAVVSVVPVPVISAFPSGINVALTGTGGIAGRNYIVESATNLVAPAGWQPLVTNQVLAGGGISFMGTNTPGFNQRFYKLKFP